MSGKKKQTILILIEYYLPGYKSGGPQTSLSNVVDFLSDEYNFKIITTDRDVGDTTPYENIKSSTWVKVGKGKVFYVPKNNLIISNIYRTIRKTPHDVLYINPLFVPVWSISIVFGLKLGLLKSKNVILAPRGELFDEALAMKRFKKSIFIKFANAIKLYKNIFWHATTENEKKYIIKVFDIEPKKIRVAQMVSSFSLVGSMTNNKSVLIDRDKSNHLNLVFLSRVSKDKNVPFTFDVLKQVKANVVFDMYGPIRDEEIWEKCQQKIKELPPNINVNYLGSVERWKVKDVLKKYDLFFLPTFAENFGHAIIESLAVGTPVLISDNTPWRDLENQGLGWDLNLEHPELFIKAIEQTAELTTDQHNQKRTDIIKTMKKQLSDPKIFESNKKLFSSPF